MKHALHSKKATRSFSMVCCFLILIAATTVTLFSLPIHGLTLSPTRATTSRILSPSSTPRRSSSCWTSTRPPSRTTRTVVLADSKAETHDGDGTSKASKNNNPLTSSKRQRFLQALPQLGKKDDLDAIIFQTAVPTMINLGVVPIVNSVDTFWVGRLGVAMALAGQSAANQASFTIFFLIAFLPSITAPLVAKAVASGDLDKAQTNVCEALYLSNLLGLLGTLLLVLFPSQVLATLVLEPNSPTMQFAAPYLRWRALGIVPSLISATGSAAYRGMLNTVTPLKVSLMTNAVNLILDPLFIFTGGMGFAGAAIATAISETLSGATYMKLLLRRKLVRWSRLLRPPPWKSLVPLLRGGAAMLFRQMALNVGFLVATRRAQLMDPTGVAGAAYGITMQIYSVGIIIMLAFQNSAAALVPASLAKSGVEDARKTADRLFTWSSIAGVVLGALQFALIPILVPIFSTLPEVREAAKTPALIASLLHVANGPILAGEGVMIGMGNFKELALITSIWIAGMVACLGTAMGKRLDGIMWSLLLSSLIQQAGVIWHYLKMSPLAVSKRSQKATVRS